MEMSATNEQEHIAAQLPIELDGSRLGAGGQLLRNSVVLSALLGKPLRITSIRQGQRPPGMRKQHVHGIQTVSNLCGGDLQGAYKRSPTMSFSPGRILPRGADLHIDLETAGCIQLVIQTLLPVLLFQPQPADSPLSSSSPMVVTIIGGTNATLVPQMDYFIHVFLPIVEKMFGVGRVKATILKRGYFPHGGGQVRLEVLALPPGQPLDAIDLVERGKVTNISGYIFSGGTIPLSIAQDMYEQVVIDLEDETQALKDCIPDYIEDFKVVNEMAVGGGSGLVLWVETSTGCVIGGSAVADRRMLPKTVAKEATSQLKETLASGACVDEFLQDQLIIFMALAKGRSRLLTTQPTEHSQIIMWVARELAGVNFTVRQSSDGVNFLIECDGIGFTS